MIPLYVPLAMGWVLWLWLMHTRTLPLEGCMCPVHLVLSLWYYGLVMAPLSLTQHAYHKTHDWALLLTSAEVVLALWMIGFVAAVISVGDEHTSWVMFAAGGVFLLMMWSADPWPWVPWFETAFGLYAWEVLLH